MATKLSGARKSVTSVDDSGAKQRTSDRCERNDGNHTSWYNKCWSFDVMAFWNRESSI